MPVPRVPERGGRGIFERGQKEEGKGKAERRGTKRQRKEGRKKEEKEIEKRKGADRTGRDPFAGAKILTDVGFKWMNLKSQITSLLSISGVPPVCPGGTSLPPYLVSSERLFIITIRNNQRFRQPAAGAKKIALFSVY